MKEHVWGVQNISYLKSWMYYQRFYKLGSLADLTQSRPFWLSCLAQEFYSHASSFSSTIYTELLTNVLSTCEGPINSFLNLFKFLSAYFIQSFALKTCFQLIGLTNYSLSRWPYLHRAHFLREWRAMITTVYVHFFALSFLRAISFL